MSASTTDRDHVRALLLSLCSGYTQDLHDVCRDGESVPPGARWTLTYSSPHKASYVTFLFDVTGRLIDIQGED